MKLSPYKYENSWVYHKNGELTKLKYGTVDFCYKVCEIWNLNPFKGFSIEMGELKDHCDSPIILNKIGQYNKGNLYVIKSGFPAIGDLLWLNPDISECLGPLETVYCQIDEVKAINLARKVAAENGYELVYSNDLHVIEDLLAPEQFLAGLEFAKNYPNISWSDYHLIAIV